MKNNIQTQHADQCRCGSTSTTFKVADHWEILCLNLRREPQIHVCHNDGLRRKLLQQKGPRTTTLHLPPARLGGWVSSDSAAWERPREAGAGAPPGSRESPLLPAARRWVLGAGATHLRLRPPAGGTSRARASERRRARGRAPGARWESPCLRAGGEVGRILLRPED